ncbi:MAG: molybdopterin cofactor-binding domain-containing protein [Syntrophorhabdales bacterium]|jgi:isoquinoline 1-oxidoreductase beta subunit
MKSSISRRDFLKGSLAAAGLTIGASLTPFGAKLLSGAEMKNGFKPTVWYEITPDNIVTVWIPSSEMGQGIRTTLAMIVADELEADWKEIRVQQAPAGDAFKNPLVRDQLTVASASVRGYYEPLRKAGAAGRMVLVKAAAKQWKVAEDECLAQKGIVTHKKSGRKLTYGKLCEKAAALQVPQEPVLKKESEFTYIGKSIPRVDIPEKVAGAAVYGMDVAVPGMLYASTARPPAFGAKPVGYDEQAATAVKGVRNVVGTPFGIGVCADSLDAAWKGRDSLKVRWDKGSLPDLNNDSIEKHFMEELDKPGSKVKDAGDAKQALAAAAKKVEAVYFVPAVAHTTMEPMNCTVHVQKDRCDVWAPTQGPLVAKMVASQVAGMPADKVYIHTTLLGCGLGRRAAPDFIVEGVILSKAAGKPVKVVWSREEDIKHDLFRPATCQRITAGLDAGGRLTAWSHKVVTPSLMKDIDPKAVVNGVDFMSLWGLADFPGSPDNNNIAYEIPNFYLEFLIDDLPIPGAPWRSVQNAPNAFVTESFIDELAFAAGKDPLAFRLELLKNNMRASRVLEKAAEKAGWGKAASQGRALGIAQHSCFGTYVAEVADISVNRKDGVIKVHKIVVAVDCGPVVNPGPLHAQIEGGVIMGLSTALKEQVKFADGGVKSANFNDYHLLKMSETPEIEIHVIDSKEKMGGMGEPPVPPVAPAVANAFFNATGVRIRRLPLDPATVMEAIREKA